MHALNRFPIRAVQLEGEGGVAGFIYLAEVDGGVATVGMGGRGEGC